MSEKSTRNALDDAPNPRMVRNCSAFRPQMHRWSCKPGHEWYNSGESVLKKEIPFQSMMKPAFKLRIVLASTAEKVSLSLD